jgi:carboxymethylenebutenolidase
VEAERVARVNVSFPSGRDTLKGSLHVPANGLPSPGVVILHDVWGVYEPYQAAGRRLADAGFVALVLDLYSRGEQPGSPADMPAVMRFLHALPDRRVLADVQAAVDFLRARPQVAGRKIGVTGFCMGGKYAFLAAARCSGIAAAVPWYGMLHADSLDDANPEHALDVVADFRCPVLAFFGDQDVLIPQHDVGELRQRAQKHGRELEAVVYTGAGHAFANESRAEAYRPEAAADAWRRALAFFATRLEAH